MFKPNSDRLNYAELLMPPEGFFLEKAVCTTYSLDLQTFVAAAIPLAMKKTPDNTLFGNPKAVLASLFHVRERLLIFCEAGQITAPKKPNGFFPLLEGCVTEVKLPKNAGRYPSFHPKTWFLHFKNAKGESHFRVIVLSRNLTFDRSWDVAVSFDGVSGGRNARIRPLVDFLHFLDKQITVSTGQKPQRKSLVAKMAEDFATVELTAEGDSLETGDFSFFSLGIGLRGDGALANEPLFRRDISPALCNYHEAVVISPFLSAGVVRRIFATKRLLGGATCALVTRKSELWKLATAVSELEHLQVFALKDIEVEPGALENADGQDSIPESSADIHAKLYLCRRNHDTALYLGSMNASESGLGRNVELLVKLLTKNGNLNGGSLLDDLFAPGIDSKECPFEECDLRDFSETEDPGMSIVEKIECALKDFCRVQKHAKATLREDFAYNLEVVLESTDFVGEVDFQICPLQVRGAFKTVSPVVPFHGLSIEQLSEFFIVKCSFGGDERARVIKIPTEGIPGERDSKIVEDHLRDGDDFAEFVFDFLGDDPYSVMEERQSAESCERAKSHHSLRIGVYERLLQAGAESPEKFIELERNLASLSGVVREKWKGGYKVFEQVARVVKKTRGMAK